MFKDPLEALLGYQLRRAGFIVVAGLSQSFAALGFTLTEATVLQCIDANPGCTQSELSRALGMQRANLAPLVAALLSRGLLERSAVDGRSQALKLSRTGQVAARKLGKLSQDNEQMLFGDLSPKLRDSLMAVLMQLPGKLAGDEPLKARKRPRRRAAAQ